MASRLQLLPLKVNQLDDIANVKPASADDECLIELRDVLVKHGKERRFGIALLHKHFDLHDDEVLLEHCDPEARTLTMKPVKRADVGRSVMETLWQVQGNGLEVSMGCETFCPSNKDGSHMGYKDHYDTDD